MLQILLISAIFLAVFILLPIVKATLFALAVCISAVAVLFLRDKIKDAIIILMEKIKHRANKN
jgi:hypothetical protein